MHDLFQANLAQVILDVSFFGTPDQEDNEIACSLRYFKGDEAVVIIEGLYDIVATVHLCLYHTSDYKLTAYILVCAGGCVPHSCERAEFYDIGERI
jgi:hypothetical protein